MSSPSPSDPDPFERLRPESAASSAPDLNLDLEEGIFRLFRSWWRRLTRNDEVPVQDPSEARLDDHLSALRVVAQVLAGAPVRIQPARDAGGVRGLDLLLPKRVALAETEAENRQILVLRTAISAAMFRAQGSRPIPEDPCDRALLSLQRTHEAIAQLGLDLPNFVSLHANAARLCLAKRPDPDSLRDRERILEVIRQGALRGEAPWNDPVLCASFRSASPAKPKDPSSPPIPIWGDLVFHPANQTASPSSEPDATEDAALPPSADASEFEAPPVEDILRIELDEKEAEDAVLIHTFEKVETADEYQGGARDTDGADELADQLEALEEVDLSEVIRGGEQAHSLLRSNIHLDAEIPQVGRCEPGETGLLYDEWDTRKGAYRKDWCTVYPTSFDARRPGWAAAARTRHAALIRELTRRLSVHRARLEAVDRQTDGEDIDLRSVVDEFAARRAGRGGNTRLYTRRARRRRSFATTVLIDLSLSSDSWVDGRRVLDVARDAAFVLGEVTDPFGDRIQILGFASHTRNHCRVWEICGWNDPWDVGRARLGALEPQGYTRIGPALRHATASLEAESADARLLLLISDGKPTDYDRYEGRYGIADVRHALHEADRVGISTHALAVDRVACDYLPTMFGPGGWHILPHPNQLPEVLATVYGRLTGR